jgi:RNA polymerase sigma factor (sigma-70 family)
MELRDIVELARSGDPRAREQVSDLLRERVIRTAGRYSSLTGMDREDLQQEMWIGALQGLQEVDVSIGDPLYYLFLRGKWRLLEAVRRSNRQKTVSLDAAVRVRTRTAFEDEVQSRLITGELERRLPHIQQVILRGLLAGQRQEEMALRLDCTPANVSYHVRRIRQGFHSLAAER